jgi:AcrR family transcriptional regulator
MMAAEAEGRAMERDLPASVAAAWGRLERGAKGPKPGLRLDRIVAAAVVVAARDGLGAVSMGRVASELGAATMALYRYVATKDELLALMVDSVFGAPAPASSRERWRAGLSRWAREHMAVLRQHPWVVRVPIAGPPLLPNQVAWFERGLWVLRDTGLAEGAKVSVLVLVNGFVRNAATLESDLRAAAEATGADPGVEYGRRLEALCDAERFPAIRSALDARVFDGADDPNAEFEFGLARILDGIAVLVE